MKDQRNGVAMSVVHAPFPIFVTDVSSILPDGWQRNIERAIAKHGYRSELHGESVTSRDARFGAKDVAALTVVDGTGVAAEVDWLMNLYRGLFLDLANELGLGRFRPSAHLVSSVNINCQGRWERYEWHVDSNPLTGLLFATTLGPDDGGELVFRRDSLATTSEDWELRIRPKAGILHLYDARAAVHSVEPVLGAQPRISIPMNFYFEAGDEGRPEDLDDYLYRAAGRDVAC